VKFILDVSELVVATVHYRRWARTYMVELPTISVRMTDQKVWKCRTYIFGKSGGIPAICRS